MYGKQRGRCSTPTPQTHPANSSLKLFSLQCFCIDNTIKAPTPPPTPNPLRTHSNSFRQSNELEDFIYFYKANIDLEPFRLGNDAFWKVHSTFFYTEDELEEHRERNGTAEEQAAGKRKRILKIEKETAEECERRGI